jgi:hypothetical protein
LWLVQAAGVAAVAVDVTAKTVTGRHDDEGALAERLIELIEGQGYDRCRPPMMLAEPEMVCINGADDPLPDAAA